MDLRLPSWLRSWIAPAVSVAALAAILVLADLDATARALANIPLHTLALALAMVLLRDLVTEVGCWWAALAAAGHRVGFHRVLWITCETVPLKYLLPFKAGDAVRVVALNRRCDVPLAVGALTRVAAMVLQLVMLLAITALLWAAPAGKLIWAAPLAAAAVLGLACGLILRLGPRWTAVVMSLMFGGISVGLSLALYALLIRTLTGAALAPGYWVVISATILACSLPASVRGVGLRELILPALAVSWGLGDRADLLGTALAVSAAEVAVVVILAAGLSAYRVLRTAR